MNDINEEMSLEQLDSILKHVKRRLAESQTDFDVYYWNLRIRDIESDIADLQRKKEAPSV